MDDVHGITSGAQFLSPSGRMWTVRAITPKGTRVLLTAQEPDGEHSAVMDVLAVLRMVRIDHSEPVATADVQHAETHLPDYTPA